MSFPTIVYRCPGEHQRPGGTYSYRGVQDEDQMKEAVSDGWFKTLGEAIEGKAAKSEKVEPAGDSAPTRKEMEEQAKMLDLKFDGRIGNAKLLNLINEAMKG